MNTLHIIFAQVFLATMLTQYYSSPLLFSHNFWQSFFAKFMPSFWVIDEEARFLLFYLVWHRIIYCAIFYRRASTVPAAISMT